MIGIVVISYKNFQGTVDFINNQLPKLKMSWKAVVIDNASDIKSSQQMAQVCEGVCTSALSTVTDEKNNVFIICSTDNLGFAKGNNLGVEFLLRNFNCDYLLFSNDDIVIEDPLVLNKLTKAFEIDKNIAVAGPRVVGTDGAEQSPHHRIVTPLRQLGWKLLPFLRRKRKVQTVTTTSIVSSYCYWVTGAFFLMKTTDFTSVNGFDPATFLYAEEVILAERLKQIGKREYFYADSLVIHYGGQSTRNIRNKKLKKILKDSNSHYYRNYLHSNPFIIWLYRVLC